MHYQGKSTLLLCQKYWVHLRLMYSSVTIANAVIELELRIIRTKHCIHCVVKEFTCTCTLWCYLHMFQNNLMGYIVYTVHVLYESFHIISTNLSELDKTWYTVEPLKNGPLKSGQPLYNGHFVWNEPILLCFTLRLRLTE